MRRGDGDAQSLNGTASCRSDGGRNHKVPGSQGSPIANFADTCSGGPAFISPAIQECPFLTVGSTGDRNTLTFLRRWSVGDEAAAADLLFGGTAG